MTVYEQLLKIRSEKMEQGIFPTYAILSELSGDKDENKKQLKELKKAGKIRIGQTINSYFIELL